MSAAGNARLRGFAEESTSAVVRPATAADAEIVFRWRNQPWVVALGASQRTVTAEEHHRWFQATLERRERELYIIEVDGQPAGTIRYDFAAPAEAEISIYLMPESSGRGHGRAAFLGTAPHVFIERDVRAITARVLKGNERSLEFFRRLGFEQQSSESGIYRLALQRPAVPHSRPSVGKEEQDAAAAVVASGHLAQGPKVAELERRWCEQTGMSAAAAVSSGLSALRLALVALGVSAGDEVIVPGYSCVALLNAPLAVGATPVLADVLDNEWTLSPEDVRRRINQRTKALIAVHLFGTPARLKELCELGIPVIEDCAHGIGGVAKLGGGGAISMSSFYATKMLCAGEGGILASHDSALIERARQARDYGDRLSSPYHLNDKMTDVVAAIALVQLNKLDSMLAARAERARRYSEWLRPLAKEGLLSLPCDLRERIWYRYAVRLHRHRASAIVARLASGDVRLEQPVWDLRKDKHWKQDLAVCSLAFDHVLSLPLYPDLTELQQRMVCAALESALRS